MLSNYTRLTRCLGNQGRFIDRLDADITHALMSINAAKGVEIGAGTKVAKQKGSEHRVGIRVVPIVEAMLAIVFMGHALRHKGLCGK